MCAALKKKERENMNYLAHRVLFVCISNSLQSFFGNILLHIVASTPYRCVFGPFIDLYSAFLVNFKLAGLLKSY